MEQNYSNSEIQNPVNDNKFRKVLPLHLAVSQNDMVRIRVDLPVKLTTPRRFILTTLRRCKLTTYF